MIITGISRRHQNQVILPMEGLFTDHILAQEQQRLIYMVGQVVLNLLLDIGGAEMEDGSTFVGM